MQKYTEQNTTQKNLLHYKPELCYQVRQSKVQTLRDMKKDF